MKCIDCEKYIKNIYITDLIKQTNKENGSENVNRASFDSAFSAYDFINTNGTLIVGPSFCGKTYPMTEVVLTSDLSNSDRKRQIFNQVSQSVP